MKIKIEVSPDHVKNIEVLPISWYIEDYRRLLDVMDYGDTSGMTDDELEEMTLLSLSDYETHEAAEIILAYLFKDKLNKGQIENLSHEILNEHPWEEYADLSLHETFFNACQILYKAYNGKFPHPTAIRFEVTFSVKSKTMLSVFDTNIKSQVIRILTQGMPTNTLLKRLFNDELKENYFPEAEHIIWQLQKVKQNETSITFDILSSKRWFEDFKYVEDFSAELDYNHD